MSDSMAIENLAEAFLRTRATTVATGTRFKLLTAANSYSDLDAFASVPETGTLHLAECKAQGTATQVYAFSSDYPVLGPGYTEDTLRGALNLFAEKNRWASSYLQLGGAAEPWSRLQNLELWLVANVMVAPADRAAVDDRFTREIQAHGIPGLPAGVRVQAHVVSTLDVFLEVLKSVEASVVRDGWGGRAGDPQLDLMRELVRYKHAFVSGGGRGASAACTEYFRSAMRAFLEG